MASNELLYQTLDEELETNLKKFTSKLRTGYVKCKGYLLPDAYQSHGDRILNLDIRDDDIWVCCFPKSGTTWVQEMVWCIANDMNLVGAMQPLKDRFPYLEFSSLCDFSKVPPEMRIKAPMSNSFDEVDNMTTDKPRFIKTHLPFELLPNKLQNFSTGAKMIHVVRNPRDALISYYHHSRLLDGYVGSFELFVDLFLKGNVLYAPFPNHVKGFLKHEDNPNILFLSYENMKKDLRSAIYQTAKFLGKEMSEDDVEKLLDHLSFSSMKENRAVNFESIVAIKKKHNLTEDKDGSFIRKGQVGDWKEALNDDLRQRFEEWEQQYLQGMNFVYSV